MNDLVWWVGAATIAIAAVYGIAEGALWVVDRTLKAFGLWPTTWNLMRRLYREKVERQEAINGD